MSSSSAARRMRSGLSGFMLSNSVSAFVSEAFVIFCPSNSFRHNVVASRSFKLHRPVVQRFVLSRQIIVMMNNLTALISILPTA
jgi:hypothetical protein